MHLRKVSTHVSLRSPRRLTWTETFRYIKIFCTLKPFRAPYTKIIVFAESIEQDQAAQNVQPDLRSTPSAMLEQHGEMIASNLPLSLSYCRINKYPLGLFGALALSFLLTTQKAFVDSVDQDQVARKLKPDL